MPPKKNKTPEELPNKTIKVKKLDSIKKINEPESIIESVESIEPIEPIAKESIIKSNVKIMEPIVEILKNEPTISKPIKKNILKTKPLDKLKVKDEHKGENIEQNEKHDEHDITEDVKEETIKEDVKETVKDHKTDKIHNHSKPKTIIASTKDVNTVDMFGEDDLDFRYVMMNYDYTKNVTMPKITKYERALLIGKRAKQIEEGANPNVKYISGQSVVSIAEEELRQRKIPLIIKRPIGNKFEYWKPADMEVNMD